LNRFYERWGFDAITTAEVPAPGSRLAIVNYNQDGDDIYCAELAGFLDDANQTEIYVSYFVCQLNRLGLGLVSTFMDCMLENIRTSRVRSVNGHSHE